jgi:hypothetical protein
MRQNTEVEPRAEPSEANPITLLMSFEGYPHRIHPRAQTACLYPEVRYGTQAWLSAKEGRSLFSAPDHKIHLAEEPRREG